MSITILLAVLALLTGSAGPDAADADQRKRKPVTHTVTVDATNYRPASLTIAAGDVVVWVNKDIIPHTATQARKGGFDSGSIEPGASWKHTFEAAGENRYVCRFHPAMRGSIRVK